MTRTIRILGFIAAAGGAAWLLKFAVIVATDGRVDDTGAAAVFFVLGAGLMAAGAATLTLRAARGRGTAIVAALLAPVLWAISFMVLDPLAQGAVGDAGPSWLQDESAIALTGAVWLVTGLVCARRATPSSTKTAAMSAGGIPSNQGV